MPNPSPATITRLAALLASVPTCRAFFVVLLTGDSSISDAAPNWFLELMQDSSIAQELLVKNLVMSSATRVSHLRHNDIKSAEGSALVAQRSQKLIHSLRSSEMKAHLLAMKSSLNSKDGIFSDFASRCKYDPEQCDAACGAIDIALQGQE